MKTENPITEKPAVELTGCYVQALIPMTDFVIKTFDNTLTVDFQVKVYNYANFLKQSLSIGMFIPCDLEGNILEEPESLKGYYETDLIGMNAERILREKYLIAKSRVIFRGFEFREKDTDLQKASICWQNILHVYWQDSIDGNWHLSKDLKIVEDLVKYGLSVNLAACT